MASTDAVAAIASLVEEQIRIQIAPVRAQLLSELRGLREEAKDTEISFTKALSQRPKGEEVLRDITHAAQRFEAVVHANGNSTADVLEGLSLRVLRLEQEASVGAIDLDSPEPRMATSRQATNGDIGDDTRHLLGELSEVLNAVDERCSLQQKCLEALSERFRTLVGMQKEGEEEKPLESLALPVLADRIDCLANALSHLDSSTQETLEMERREREVLNRLLSERMAQEVADRTRACSKLADEVESIANPLKFLRSPSPAIQPGYAGGHYASGTSIELPHQQLSAVTREHQGFRQPPVSSSPPHPPPSDGFQPQLEHVASVSSASRVGLLLPAGASSRTSPRSRCPPSVSWSRQLQHTSPRHHSPDRLLSTGTSGQANLHGPPHTLRPGGTSGLRSSVPVLTGREAGPSSVMRSASQPQPPPGPLDRRQSQVAVIVATSSSATSGRHDGGSPATMGRTMYETTFDTLRPADVDLTAPRSPQVYKGPVRMSTHGSMSSAAM